MTQGKLKETPNRRRMTPLEGAAEATAFWYWDELHRLGNYHDFHTRFQVHGEKDGALTVAAAIYARVWVPPLDKQALVLQRIDATRVGTGAFTRYLDYLEPLMKGGIIMVQGIQSERFENFFIRRGYTSIGCRNVIRQFKRDDK